MSKQPRPCMTFSDCLCAIQTQTSVTLSKSSSFPWPEIFFQVFVKSIKSPSWSIVVPLGTLVGGVNIVVHITLTLWRHLALLSSLGGLLILTLKLKRRTGVEGVQRKVPKKRLIFQSLYICKERCHPVTLVASGFLTFFLNLCS